MSQDTNSTDEHDGWECTVVYLNDPQRSTVSSQLTLVTEMDVFLFCSLPPSHPSGFWLNLTLWSTICVSWRETRKSNNLCQIGFPFSFLKTWIFQSWISQNSEWSDVLQLEVSACGVVYFLDQGMVQPQSKTVYLWCCVSSWSKDGSTTVKTDIHSTQVHNSLEMANICNNNLL